MAAPWPSTSYAEWSETCDTLHAHTQVLGKLAAELAPPEPQLQHAALRLTARGWETAPLAAPGEAGSPRDSTSRLALGSSVGCSNWSSAAGSTRRTASALSISP